MHYGPLTISEFRRVSEGLKALSIPFKSNEDEDERKKAEEKWKSGPTAYPAGPTYDPAYIYLEIADGC